jgi:acyl-CoA thioesterase-1
MVLFFADIMMLRVLFILAVLVACPARAIATDTILLIGDSLSAAYGIPADEGWVTLLQQRLETEHYPFRLVNASISGDTTAAALARLPRALETHQPSIVILQLGGNDGLRGLSLAELKQNLATMIDMAASRRASSLLLGVHLPPNYGRRYTERFHSVYHELARETRTPLVASLVDGIGNRSELMQADGIHPNRQAQPLIAERVWVELEPMLEHVIPGGD